ncbi:MAG: phage holin family protein [Pyrinomonadaceae bacterium]
MAASKTALTTAKDASAPSETESLTGLVSRLGDDVMQLFDTKLSLLKVEIKEEVNAYARGGIAISLGGIVAAVGFAFVNIAVAFAVSTLFANTNLSQAAKYAIGFVVTGMFYVIVGGVVILSVKNRLAKQDLVPSRTLEELRKDKQWVKNEL